MAALNLALIFYCASLVMNVCFQLVYVETR